MARVGGEVGKVVKDERTPLFLVDRAAPLRKGRVQNDVGREKTPPRAWFRLRAERLR